VDQIAVQERPSAELTPDRVDRPGEAAAGRITVAELGAEEDARVELVRVGRPRVTLLPLRPAALLDERPDRAGFRSPPLDVTRRDLTGGREASGTVERDPAHHLRLCEVPDRPPDLPDASVGLRPDVTHEVRDG